MLQLTAQVPWQCSSCQCSVVSQGSGVQGNHQHTASARNIVCITPRPYFGLRLCCRWPGTQRTPRCLCQAVSMVLPLHSRWTEQRSRCALHLNRHQQLDAAGTHVVKRMYALICLSTRLLKVSDLQHCLALCTGYKQQLQSPCPGSPDFSKCTQVFCIKCTHGILIQSKPYRCVCMRVQGVSAQIFCSGACPVHRLPASGPTPVVWCSNACRYCGTLRPHQA